MSQEPTNVIYDRQIRGKTSLGWLDSYHTFSFGGFHDPERMGFRSLRVINEDRVVPGAAFGNHSHQDMEIITYVLEGRLAHQDSLGNRAEIYPGEAQIMSAGTGITHNEFNPDKTQPVHFLQIWIIPDTRRLQPRYEQRSFSIEEKQGKLRLIAAKDGREGAVTIHQEIDLYVSLLESGNVITYNLKANHYAWVQVARGIVTLNGHELRAGDGVQIGGEEQLEISTDIAAEILLFDLA